MAEVVVVVPESIAEAEVGESTAPGLLQASQGDKSPSAEARLYPGRVNNGWSRQGRSMARH